ncbi:MAG: glycosyltransferase family 2 protein, partial [Planctomycetes bacterium]|nr:glycosyltransferase family 2 protein [Planctomycetota bacterium]
MNFTFVIKTFNRYDCLERLLISINRFYPSAPIVVVDDSTVKRRLELFDQKQLLLFELPGDSAAIQ